VAYVCPLQGTVFAKLAHAPEMNVFHRGLLVIKCHDYKLIVMDACSAV